ncbi:hypothetical protein NPIL_311851 [Nephila pilipes]|uniref:Uncharacterized protein n=1 Tax=Nephila pilipes TaxID=299642 RepID=A0A8X6TMQ7_NEPPI|nr:hypothetical protein NPIL_311851 [Nephila pilipes]
MQYTFSIYLLIILNSFHCCNSTFTEISLRHTNGESYQSNKLLTSVRPFQNSPDPAKLISSDTPGPESGNEFHHSNSMPYPYEHPGWCRKSGIAGPGTPQPDTLRSS